MEAKKKLGVGAIVGIVALALLSAFALAAEIVGTIWYYSGVQAFIELFTVGILYIGLIYYAVSGYKKSHGDVLRYIFMLTSLYYIGNVFCITVNDISMISEVNTALTPVVVSLLSASAVIIAYVGGRLDKIKKNYAIMAVATAVQLAVSVVFIFSYGVNPWIDALVDFSNFILWLDIVFVYVLRYKRHKEAGLTDKN